MTITANGLQAAEQALRELAAGRVPGRAAVVAGALALDTAVSRDLQDAAHALRAVAAGDDLDLDTAGRDRAAYLAAIVAAVVAVID